MKRIACLWVTIFSLFASSAQAYESLKTCHNFENNDLDRAGNLYYVSPNGINSYDNGCGVLITLDRANFTNTPPLARTVVGLAYDRLDKERCLLAEVTARLYRSTGGGRETVSTKTTKGTWDGARCVANVIFSSSSVLDKDIYYIQARALYMAPGGSSVMNAPVFVRNTFASGISSFPASAQTTAVIGVARWVLWYTSPKTEINAARIHKYGGDPDHGGQPPDTTWGGYSGWDYQPARYDGDENAVVLQGYDNADRSIGYISYRRQAWSKKYPEFQPAERGMVAVAWKNQYEQGVAEFTGDGAYVFENSMREAFRTWATLGAQDMVSGGIVTPFSCESETIKALASYLTCSSGTIAAVAISGPTAAVIAGAIAAGAACMSAGADYADLITCLEVGIRCFPSVIGPSIVCKFNRCLNTGLTERGPCGVGFCEVWTCGGVAPEVP